MRNKTAKKLRHMAEVICLKEGTKLGEGYREYHQAMNCPRWEEFIGEDGLPMIDPDTGRPNMVVKPGPGTITTAWRVRAIYKQLKKAWKEGYRDRR